MSRFWETTDDGWIIHTTPRIPWEPVVAELRPGDTAEAKITREIEGGFLVAFPTLREDRSHINTFLPVENAPHGQSVAVGDEHRFRIVEISTDELRIVVSLE